MGYIRHPNINCIVCNNPIYRRPWEIKQNKGNVFCSAICYGRFNRKEKSCLVCGTLILSHFNKKTCSRACANINRIGVKYKMGRPHDKVVDQRRIKLRLLKARGNKCEGCGYSKIEILHVHHKDRNRQNNLLSNLKLFCPNCHYEEHYFNKSWLKRFNFKDFNEKLEELGV